MTGIATDCVRLRDVTARRSVGPVPLPCHLWPVLAAGSSIQRGKNGTAGHKKGAWGYDPAALHIRNPF
jgi:hypothetical protein